MIRPFIREFPRVDDRQFWRLATALSGADTVEAVADAVSERAPGAAGAVFANTAIFDPATNQVRVIHPPSLAPDIAERWAEFPIDERTPLNDAILTGSPVLLPNLVEIGAQYPGLHRDTRDAGLEATASMPLRVREGPTLGAVGFAWSERQDFSDRLVARLKLIASLTAHALERITDHRSSDRAEAGRARALQEAFLPASLPQTDHLEVAAAYLPASDSPMGGDWYDAFSVEGGTCLAVGDVAGHGWQSVAVMASLRHTVRAFADEDPAPARVVTRVNRMLCRLHPDTTATMIVAVWHPEERTLIRTNAGHPPVLRCRAGDFGFLPKGAGNGVLLGVDPEWQYGEEAKVLRPGTTLLLYTDGLVEARHENLEAGLDRLLRFAEQRRDLSPQSVCDDLLLWRLTEGSVSDDVCMVAARMF